MKKLLFLLIILISNGSIAQNTQEIIDGLKKDLKANPDAKTTTTIYSDLTWFYSNVSLDSAMVYGKKAIKESLKLGDSTLIAQAYGDVSTVYLKKGDYDESLKCLKNVLAIRKAKNDIPGLARTYSGIALLYFTESKYELSMKNYLIALEYVNKTNDDKAKNNIKNAMSGLLLDLKDYKKALLYSKQSIAYFENVNSTQTLCPMYINEGNIYLGLKDTLRAMKMYEKAKVVCNETGNKLFLSKALNNIGVIKVAQKKYEDSKKLFDESKQNRKELNSEILDYKAKFNDIDNLNREEKFKDSKVLLLQLKKYFENQNDSENLITTYKLLIPVCSNLRENDSVAFYQIKFLDVSQKLNDADILKKTIELETKYQTAKKEKQIIQQKAEAKQKNTYLIGLSLLTLFISFVGFLIYKQQKQKIKQQEQEHELKNAIAQIEMQNKLQEQRLSISRDLHDNIGAQLTFVISSVDNLKFGNQITDTKINNQLSKISDFTKSTIIELRDTIWAMNTNEFTFDDLRSRIFNFIEKAKSAKEDINFKFNVDENVKKVKFSSIIGINLYRTMQEAVNNAVKYADAKEIEVNVSYQKNQTKIEIKDNGNGFDMETVDFGNGLTNMRKRIDEIGGNLIINSETNKGTTISILLSKKR